MECTQRLECLTQELYESQQQQKTCNEQIGFLGICGKKYPVMKGPNKIGRDPTTCNIVLDLNSVSRQHAVINILNSTEYMIMDLDSANKTKLLNRTLPPYIPHALKNGDTVQFGLIFGIFRLLEEDDELPMTQALDIPDTPVVNRLVTKLNNLPSTTIPESPDCSDKDESFIVSSQSKNQDEFKSPSSHYIKTSSKAIAIQPIGINKIDNVYWKSSKKSVSMDMGLDDSNEGLVHTANSVTAAGSVVNDNIHEMDTQVPFPTETNEVSDAIHTANTQLFTKCPSISGLDTHAITMNNLPESKKINKQQDMKFDLFTENKENNNSIYNAETQIFEVNEVIETKKQIHDKNLEEPKEENSNSKLNISDEEIIFDEIDSLPLAEDFESQPLLPPETLNMDENRIGSNYENTSNNTHFNDKQVIRTRLNSDSSTDCEDFDLLPTQKIQENYDIKGKITDNTVFKSDTKLTNVNDDSIECEDNAMETNEKVNPIKCNNILGDDNDSTDCEDNVISCNLGGLNKEANVEFEDLATQVIAVDVPNENDDVKDRSGSDLSFEEMPTQVIETVDMQNTSKKSDDICFEDLPTQVLPLNEHDQILEQNGISQKNLPFKVPFQSIKRNKKNEVIKTNVINPVNTILEDDNFYNATQEIFNDLCTQDESLTERKKSKASNCNLETKNDHLIDKSQKLTKKTHVIVDKSSEISDGDDKFNKLETSLLSKDNVNIVCKDGQKSNRSFSDSSDVESTPKKPIKFMETVLPNSQEIKKSVRLKTAKTFEEFPSDSEQENDEREEYTSIIKRKNKTQINARTDLAKKFETESLPTRVLTRVRKPTAKLQNSNIDMNNMMKSRLLTEPEENIDTEIITENILRLKANASKHKKDGEIKKNCETKSEYKQSHEEQNDIKVLTRLPNTINTKESNEKIDAKRKSNESEKYGNEKSKKDYDDQKKNKSNKSNNNFKTIETKNQSEKKSMDVKKDDRTHNKIKDSKLQKSDKKSEKSSRRSQRKRGSAQVDEKQKKISESSENKAPAIHVKKQKDEDANPSSKQEISKNDRSGRKEQSGKNQSNSSTSDRTESSDKNNKRKRNIDDKNRNESSSEKEVRRSKRQKTIKNYLEPNPEQTLRSSISDSKLKKHEQSTIYSLSSESGMDSPKEKSLKSSAKSDVFDNIKKSSTSKLVSNTSLRTTPRNIKTHKVLFTAFPSEEVKVKLMKLGAIIVTEVAECTVLLTLQIKRTFKLLCAIGLGKPIVGPSWVQTCSDTNMIVDPWLYLIKDEASEKRFHFNLEQTLTGKRNFLQGYNVSSTPSVVPNASEMKLIVECSGGKWKEGGSKWICISSSSDKTLWLSLKRKGAILVSTEFILEGVLQQRLDLEKHRIRF